MQATPDSRDKVSLAVGLLTVLVTVIISGYKETLSAIKIPASSYQFSAFDLLIWASITLFGSVYFSALDNLKERNFHIFQHKFFDMCGFFADALYTFAILILPAFFYLFICWFSVIIG